MRIMAVNIKEISGKKALREFIKFPERLYKDCPQWVPALMSDELRTLGDKNPALDFCERSYFLAYDENGDVVGRVAAIINHNANTLWNERTVRFGWIDFVDDRSVSAALIDKVAQWGRSRGCNRIKGPLGFTDLDKEGLLVEGFEHLAPFTVIYNYPYYIEHLEALGFRKDIDWTQKIIDIPDQLPKALSRAGWVENRFNIHMIENMPMNELRKRYGMQIFHVCNDSFSKLYEFTPLTDRQIEDYLDTYCALLSTDFVAIVVDENDKAVGFAFTVPSLSKAMKKAKGRLFPLGFLHLLRALKKNDVLEALMIGILPEYQGTGAHILLFKHIHETCLKYGIRTMLANPQLETNSKVQNIFNNMYETHEFLRRRCYVKELS